MPNDAIAFAVDSAVAPELALAAAGLAEGLGGSGHACEVLVDPSPQTLAGRTRVIEVGDGDHAPERWRLSLGARSELELVDPAERSSPVPFAVPTLRASAIPGRIVFIGGDAGRRTRMMAKTFDALRRRGRSVVVWRPLPDELLRQRFAGEVHSELSGPELTRLLASAAVLVEVSDESTAEGMLLAAIGRASGTPTVVHAMLPAPEWEGRIVVSEWSGEAFAEAAIAAAELPRNDAVGAEIRKLAAGVVAGALA